MRLSPIIKINLRYTALQAAYWAAFAGFYAFAAVFLEHRGFTFAQIGVILALSSILGAVLQPFLGSFAGKPGRISIEGVIFALAAASLLSTLLLYICPNYFWLTACLYGLGAAAVNSMIPFISSLCFAGSSAAPRPNFGFARSMGSLVYAIFTSFTGVLVERLNPDITLLIALPPLVLLLLLIQSYRAAGAATAASTGKMPEAPGSLPAFMARHRRFMLFILGGAIIFTAYNMCITYLAQIIEALGGTKADFGVVLAMSAVLEIPSMMFFTKLARRIRCSTLLRLTGVFFFLKALCYLAATSMWMVYLGQLAQPLSFAMYVVAAVYYTNAILPEEDKVLGQSLLTASLTLGNVTGTMLGGWMLDNTGVFWFLVVAVAASAVGAVFFIFSVEKTGLGTGA